MINRILKSIKAYARFVTLSVVEMCLLGISFINAQENTLYNSHLIIQSSQVNPTNFLPYRTFTSFPPLGSIKLSLYSSGITLSDALTQTDTGTVIDISNVIQTIGEEEFLGMKLSYQPFLIGFTFLNKHQFSLSNQIHVSNQFYYSKDFLSFLWFGNGYSEFIGKELNFSNLGFNTLVYSEYALGYTGKFLDNKLTLGIKPKILFGKLYLNTLNSSFSFYTSENLDEIRASAHIEIQTAGIPSFSELLDTTSTATIDPLNIILDSYANVGYATDLGASFRPIEKLEFSASIVNLGKIKWNKNSRTYTTKEVSFSFEGIDINQFMGQETDTSGNLIDSLLQQVVTDFQLQEKESAFTSSIPLDFYVGTTYHITKAFSTNLLFNGNLYSGKFTPSFTFGVNARLNYLLEGMISYTMMPRSYNNIGIGMAAQLGPVQLFVLSNNILGFTQLDYSKNLNLMFGMNVGLKSYKKGMEYSEYKAKKKEEKAEKKQIKLDKKTDTDKDGIMDFDDLCRALPGLVNFKGCPDTDNDSIEDKVDECPTQFGKVVFNGCPDSDSDSIRDLEDKCPEMFGLKFLDGCPDDDLDSIPNNLDECPQEYGKLNGCPDNDLDSIPNKNDQCPDLAGSIFASGCPDLDNDGISDTKDMCPELAGESNYSGCPDSDLDGIPDNYDFCSDKFGPIENFGCPVDEQLPK